MPIEIRREIPKVLQAIGTPAAQDVLLESVLDRDTVLRYHVITALNKLGQVYPGAAGRSQADRIGAGRRDHGPLPLVSGARHAGRLGRTTNANPIAQGLSDSMEQETERIFRLLKILYPAATTCTAPTSACSRTIRSCTTTRSSSWTRCCSPQLRALLVPLFDRGVSPAQRAHLANRMLGASLGDREEAIEVMALSQDPWLRSCAAYAMGELRLTRFASKIDEWCDARRSAAARHRDRCAGKTASRCGRPPPASTRV